MAREDRPRRHASYGAFAGPLKVERTEDDWVHVWSDGIRFEGACGPLNLGELLEAFRDFVDNAVPVTD
ncbi:Imm53 family immunity protein [Nonomuraea sp. NPDC048881]|uniref:Imm53 family immunity protein n=1 Tax=Nonomuraea sp. NPDC048881 TaxID=3155030 RepID=UPI0033EC560D